MRKKILLTALVLGALLLASCGTDTPLETSDASETTDTEAVQQTETEAETEPPFVPVEYTLSDGETVMLNAFTTTIYESTVESAATQVDGWRDGRKNVLVCDVTLASGEVLRLEFADDMASSGIFYLIEAADENGVSPKRLFDIIAGEICLGASDNSPYKEDDYEKFAAEISGGTVTAADGEVVAHRYMKVYTVVGGEYEKVAFDDFTRNAHSFKDGEWVALGK